MTFESRLSEPLLLRPSEAARLLSISRSRCYEMIAAGQMPGVVRLGRTVRVSIRALQAWIDEQAKGGGMLACRGLGSGR